MPQLYNMLSEDQAMEYFNLWLEFENRETAEAKFARAMDNIQPNMLNNATGGEMWNYQYNKLIKPNAEMGYIINVIEENSTDNNN